jgi:CheY-like chemotaxis protein
MAGELVLIVEDNEPNFKLARDVLRFKGYRTLEARTGAEGLELARAHRPDLVLLDVRLPDTDGVAALGRLRAAPARRLRYQSLAVPQPETTTRSRRAGS